MELNDMVRVARGAAPADLVLRNARLVNVYSGEIYPTDVAILGSHVVGIGPGYEAHQEIDLKGSYLAPGLIDGHVHIESSMVGVRQFAEVVVPRGVTAVIADPHEIANVLGLDGIRYMFDQAKYGQLSMFVMVPSCVPATHMATSGAYLEAKDIAALQNDPWVLGLGEMMNYPGVVHGDQGVLDKIAAFKTRVLDGHAPGMTGKALNAYLAAGIGSDHECTTVEEALERLRLGMYILVREATNAHNLGTLLPLISPDNARRLCFCTDDRHPADLLDQGGVDFLVRSALRSGVDLVTAIRMATLNTAEWFRLYDRGGIRPGNRADLIVFDDPQALDVRLVLRGGQIVAEDGVMLPYNLPDRLSYLRGSMNVNWHSVNFTIPAEGRCAHVIGVIPDQLSTEDRILEIPAASGVTAPDIEQDIIKIAVIERHMASGRIGKGFVQGLGLRRGAIASTIAHDHHNLIIAGADNVSMTTAAAAVGDMGGGLTVADGIHILAQLPLPVAGLMSNRPITEVRQTLDEVIGAARNLGSELHDPFMALSFLALEVIPHLKLTDQGLVDVDQFKIVPLWVD
ncbi:MAG: adenine deaminase [Chloroflexi bacterium HGW-Chloroflexi-1]|nr:MAG: adenine deaminase [Chloroflexi bacterium HGW-Chloroflexi-1]